MNVFTAALSSFLWLSLPGGCGVAGGALLADASFLIFIWLSDFYLASLQLVLCRVAAVKRLPVHQP